RGLLNEIATQVVNVPESLQHHSGMERSVRETVNRRVAQYPNRETQYYYFQGRSVFAVNRAEFRYVFCRRVWHQETRRRVRSSPELRQTWLKGLKSKDHSGERTQSRARRLPPAFPLTVSTIPAPERFRLQPRLFAALSIPGEGLSP